MRAIVASVLISVTGSSLPALVMAAPLQPTTSWDVDYGETQCAAARSFGSAPDPITFAIVPSISGQIYRLIVNEQRQGPIYAEESRASVRLGEAQFKTWALHFGKKGVRSSNYEFHLPAADMQKIRSATTISLNSDDGHAYEFALSEMPALMDALGKCTEDLQQYWNYGDSQVRSDKSSTLKKTSKGELRVLFRPDDYPSEALRRSQDGTAQYQLLIDEKGAVAGCDLIVESGVPVIDAMGCQVLKERAKFTPASGQGKAARSVLTTPPIVWRLEG